MVLSASSGFAAEPPTKETLEELQFLREETVSIAARHEQPISEAPSNVYVITDEDIRHSGATDIPTVLRRIPGIEVMQVTGADFNVSARGDNELDTNKILVMVDGRAIYNDVQGNVIWKALPVTLPEIKRIEVLKGPASALYGFNAFDGIINIITKSPEEMKGTTLQFGGGEFGTITSAAVQAGTIEKLGYRLSVGRDQNNQWRDRNALAFRSHKFNVQTEYGLTAQSRLLVSGGLVDANRFDGPFSEDVVISTQPAQGYANVAYERLNFLLRGYWNRYNDRADVQFNPLLAPFLRNTDRNGSSISSISANTYNIDAQHAVELGAQHRLTYGGTYRHNTLASNFISQFSTEDRLGFFLQDEWKAANSLTVVGSVRYDLHTEIHGTLSPRLALLYQVAPDHTFRIAGSVAYRPPTLFETKENSLAVSSFPSPPVVVAGSSDLSPEEIVSYEAGYQGWFIRHRLRARADVFFNHISNLISARTLSPTLATFVNDPGVADIYGGEAGVEFLATRWLTGFANYSYNDVGQTFTGRIQRGGPHYKSNVGLRGEWENNLSVEAVLHHVGPATYPPGQSFTSLAAVGLVQIPDPRVGSYNLLNLRAGYRFWKEKAEVAVSVFNALNDQHKEHPLGDTISSRVMGWLTMRF